MIPLGVMGGGARQSLSKPFVYAEKASLSYTSPATGTISTGVGGLAIICFFGRLNGASNKYGTLTANGTTATRLAEAGHGESVVEIHSVTVPPGSTSISIIPSGGASYRDGQNGVVLYLTSPVSIYDKAYSNVTTSPASATVGTSDGGILALHRTGVDWGSTITFAGIDKDVSPMFGHQCAAGSASTGGGSMTVSSAYGTYNSAHQILLVASFARVP